MWRFGFAANISYSVLACFGSDSANRDNVTATTATFAVITTTTSTAAAATTTTTTTTATTTTTTTTSTTSTTATATAILDGLGAYAQSCWPAPQHRAQLSSGFAGGPGFLQGRWQWCATSC